MEFKEAFEQARVLEETQACGNTAKVARALYRHIEAQRALTQAAKAINDNYAACIQERGGEYPVSYKDPFNGKEEPNRAFVPVSLLNGLRDAMAAPGALEPQGQALPLWRAEKSHDLARAYDENGDEIAGGYAKEVFAFVDAHNTSIRAYASQLALPAGPVPEGRTAISLCDEYGSAVIAFTTEEVQAVRHAALEEAARVAEANNYTGAGIGAARAIRALKNSSSPAVAQHSDDIAVDRFAIAMKKKLAKAREKGRGGWENCSQAMLSRMLREHVGKGDPRDVANFCMMLWNNGAGIAAVSPAVAQPVADEREAHYQNVLSALGEMLKCFDDGVGEDWSAATLDKARIAYHDAITAQPICTIDKRAAFEADMFKTGMAWDNSQENDGDGDEQYADPETRLNWDMWQAGFRAALCPPAEEGGKS